MRADQYLANTGLSESRTKAQKAIEEGRLYVNGINVKKSSAPILETDSVELRGEDMPFVSRGGLKLLGAINTFGLDVSSLTAVDIGASTGGFTDCLLQHGAKKVYAVDCGTGQLHKKVKDDVRVVNIEGFNARELTRDTLGETCDIAVMDVSFISQTLLYGAVKSTVKDGGLFVSLIKPQFEAGRSAVGRGGIVKDKKIHVSVIRRILSIAEGNGLRALDLAVSPIEGGDGNTEYLALFRVGASGNTTVTEEYIKSVVSRS